MSQQRNDAQSISLSNGQICKSHIDTLKLVEGTDYKS